MLPSGLPEHVGDEEDLARFLTSSSQLSGVMVKAAAFLPNPKDHKKSVFRHGAEPRTKLIEIARAQILAAVTIHGAAIVKAGIVRAAQLDVISEEPPPLHANIVGWPLIAADPDLQKAQEKERALTLAANSVLVRFD
jgi:hypothetical protein